MQMLYDTWLLWSITFLFLALLVVSFIIGIYKKKKEEKKRILRDWERVRYILKEKELNEKEIKLLEEIIHKYDAQNPLGVTTFRQHFVRCVYKYIINARKYLDFEELDEVGEILREISIRLGHDYIPYGQRIYTTVELYQNQPLWMSPQGENPSLWRKGNVVDINGAFFRVAPYTPQDRLPINLGQYISFKMWREDDARYQFSTVLRKIELDPEVYVFDHAFSLERFQSRAYFRVRLDKPIEADVVTIDKKYDLNQISAEDVSCKIIFSTRARIVNLSAGGSAILIDRDIEEGLFLRILLDMEDDKEPKFITLYMRIINKVNVALGRYIYRGAFMGLTDENRDRLAKYVFRQQPPVSSALREQQKKDEEKKI
ncbi:MAG: PilZ domain-containing protein [Candidatus Hydrogenedens sp.]